MDQWKKTSQEGTIEWQINNGYFPRSKMQEYISKYLQVWSFTMHKITLLILWFICIQNKLNGFYNIGKLFVNCNIINDTYDEIPTSRVQYSATSITHR